MKKLAVFFPGLGYNNDKPLMYYQRKLAEQYGYVEQLLLTYPQSDIDMYKNIKGAVNHPVAAPLYRYAESVLSSIDMEYYDRVLFISKSIGTVLAARYEQEHNVKCRQILMTPVTDTLNYIVKQGIYFSGTSDPLINQKVIPPEYTVDGTFTMIEDANHSLETDDIIENIKILKKIIKISERFIHE